MEKFNFPKITIVTPSFNQCQFLEETINSVLSQNYPNLEYIVFDDASTDGSKEIIQKYSGKIYYYSNSYNKGQGSTLNEGFKYSTGEIMGWINSDDVYFPWTFKVVAEIFSTLPTVDWLTSETKVLLNADGSPYKRSIFLNFGKSGFRSGLYLPNTCNCIPQESTFWRRRLWELSGGYIDNLRLVPDFELWSRFWKYSDLYTIPTPLGAIRMHKEQKTAVKFSACYAEAYKIWKENDGYFSTFPLRVIQQVFMRIPLLGYAFRKKNRITRYDYDAIKWYSLRFNISRFLVYLTKIFRKIL